MTSYDFNSYSSNGQYANLGAYQNGYSMSVPPQGKAISGAYIVPQFDAISYGSLTAPVPNPSGYFTIEGAYGKNAGSCQTTYRTSLCNPK